MKIRPFSLDDLEPILQIQKACKGAPQWEQQDYEKLAGDRKGMIMVADPEWLAPQRLLGFAAFFRVDDEAELWSLAVERRSRRRGIAKSLLLDGCRRLSDAGARRLFLEVRGSNKAAVELYRSLGFRLLTTRRDYYRNPPEDALVLALKLGLSAARSRV